MGYSFLSGADGDTKEETETIKLETLLGTLETQQSKRKMELETAGIQIAHAKQKLQKLRGAREIVDYGFQSKSGGSALDGWVDCSGSGTVPKSAFILAGDNFNRELRAIISTIHGKANDAIDEDDERGQKLASLVLSNDAIWAREESRPQIEAPNIIKVRFYYMSSNFYRIDDRF